MTFKEHYENVRCLSYPEDYCLAEAFRLRLGLSAGYSLPDAEARIAHLLCLEAYYNASDLSDIKHLVVPAHNPYAALPTTRVERDEAAIQEFRSLHIKDLGGTGVVALSPEAWADCMEDLECDCGGPAGHVPGGIQCRK